MRQTLIGAVLLVPAVLTAQVAVQGQAKSQGTAQVNAPNPQASAQARLHANANASFNAPERFSASGKAKLEAMYAAARQRGLSPEPMANRVAEGEAKRASETSVIAAAGKVQADMETSQEAMLAAGRAHPSGEECARGAMLMERGATSAQIEAMARHTPSNRSLVVAFDVVSRLASNGVPVTQALARVQARIDSHASDATLLSLAGSASGSASGGVAGGAMAGGRSPNAAGAANAAATGTANAATKGVGTGVTGTVTGVIRKP